MKIQQKLIGGFAGVTILVGVVGYISLDKSQRALTENVRLRSIEVAVESLNQIDRAVDYQIETFREYTRDLTLQKTIRESNNRFGRMKDAKGFIDTQDRRWRATRPDSLSAFMRDLMGNSLSDELREKAAFYEAEFGHKFVGRAVVANKYGVNVAQTGRTAKFRHDDEHWWQHARREGVCICSFAPDSSAGTYSAEIGIRVDDEKGMFLGVINVALNVENITEVIGSLDSRSSYETISYILLDSSGLVIYDGTGKSAFLEDISHTSMYSQLRDDRGFYADLTGDALEGETVFSYAHSQGIRDFGGLNWTLVAEFDPAEVFGPLRGLESVIISLTVGLALLAGIIGMFMARSISRPLGRLCRAAKKIGGGDLSLSEVTHESSDELGELVTEFNTMAESLRSSTASLAELNREMEERKLIEESLRKSEEKYHDLFENAPIAYFSVNVDGTLARLNKIAEQMLGYNGNELIGKSILTLYADTRSGNESAAGILEKMQRGEKSNGVELQMRRKDGSVFWVSLSVRPILDDSGNVLASRSTAVDITKRKEAEEALSESERNARGQVALLDHLYTAAPVGLGLIDTSFRFVRVNDHLASMHGLNASDHIGKTVREVAPHIAEKLERHLSEVISTGEPVFDIEYSGLTDAGSGDQRIWQASHYPLRSFNGEILGVSVLVMDVTEQRSREREFRFTQFTVENTADAAFWVGPDARVLYVNRKACESLGYTREELLSMSVPDFSAKRTFETWPALWQDVKQQGTTNLESVHIRKDGSKFPVDILINYLEFEGQEFICAFARDVSARKKSEEALRLTQFSVDHAADAAFWVAPDGTFSYVNSAACKMLEYSPEELLAISVFDVSPDFPKSGWEEHWQEIKRRGSFSFEAVHQTKTGRKFPVEIRVNYLEFEGREYNFAFARDVSAWKEAEGVLRSLVVGTTAASSSDEFFGSLVKEMALALSVKHSFIGEIESPASKTLETIAVCSDGELVENVVYELAGTPCEKALKEGMCYYPREVTKSFPDSELLVEMGVDCYLGVPLFDSDNRPLGLLSVMSDAPLRNIELAKDLLQVFAQRAGAELVRKKTELALQRGEELLRATLDSTGDGILVINDKSEVTHKNRRFIEMFNFPQHALDTQDDQKLLEYALDQFADPEVFLARVHALYESKDEDFENLIMNDGRVIDRYSCPLIQDGKIAGRVWSFREVTDRVRAQEQEQTLRESLERAKRMESMGILAGGVAHDLNNTLGPLVGYPELILQKLPEDSPVREQIKRMGKSASEAAEVIQDLLALARRGRYEMKPVCLNTVLSEYLKSRGHSKLVEERPDVIFRVEFGESPVCINGSGAHLSKVIMNLIVNAFDAIGDGGTVSVKTSRRELTSLLSGYADIAPGEYILLQVKDSGKGIETELLEKIFEPYFSKKALGSSGSGLGLSVVYGVVKDHKGYYDVFSTPGEGAEFVLYFPVTLDEVDTPRQPVGDIRGNQSALVIDDSPDQRTLAAQLLSSLGYRVDVVENGRQAVEYLKDKSVDILILDMIMEDDFDGLDTYREILKIHPHQKAVVVSGFSATNRVQELQRLGVGEYVKKPYTVEILGAAVRKELDRTSTQTPA